MSLTSIGLAIPIVVAVGIYFGSAHIAPPLTDRIASAAEKVCKAYVHGPSFVVMRGDAVVTVNCGGWRQTVSGG